MPVKLLLVFLLGGIGLLGCSDKRVKEPVPGNVVASISVANPSNFPREDELIYLPLERLGKLSGPLSARHQGQELPSQLIDRDGDGAADHLAVLLQLSAAEKISFNVLDMAAELRPQARVGAEISIKEDGTWQDRKYLGGKFVNVNKVTVPAQHTDHSEYIRYEGPGIESEKVGYRVYLDWRNGFDVFGKVRQAPALQNIGQDGFESYHHMSDWGMDILKVGKSVGVGGFGYWDGEQLLGVADTASRSVTVLENGPLYSSFAIDYGQWKVAGKVSDIRAIFSMTAGSRKVEVRLLADPALEPLAIGLVKLPEVELLLGNADITGKAYTYVGTWGQQSLAGDQLGLALLFKRDNRAQQTEDMHNWASVMEAPGGTLSYYFLAAWAGEPEGIENRDQFERHLKQEAERLTQAVRLTIRGALDGALAAQPLTPESVLQLAVRMADTELQRKAMKYRYGGWDFERDRPSRWEYTTGILMQAFDDLAVAGADAKFAQAAETVIGSFIKDDGTIAAYKPEVFNIDSVAPGNMLLRLHQRTGESRYRLAADILRKQLADHPKTSNGAFWHKKRYPHQLWLDGVYMGMPFLTGYTLQYEQGASLQQAVHEFEVTRQQLRSDSGLYWHGWDEARQQPWADSKTGLSRHHWGRGNGWLAMAIVDVLELLPADDPASRQLLQDMLQDLAQTLVRYQDPQSGVWYQIMDMPEARGNYLEASASAMFVYALAKGINMGALPESFKAAALKGYQGLVAEFVSQDPDGDVHLNNICLVAGLGFGRDGSYEYYMSEPVVSDDPKGTAPFLMASVQISTLLVTSQ